MNRPSAGAEVMVVTTVSGSRYLFSPDMKSVCRAEHTHDMRRDNEWVKVVSMTPVVIGEPLKMLLDLDAGENLLTIRTTSSVTNIDTDVLGWV